MLNRIGGGDDGIKAYLEDGTKQGRLWTRDELDERVILAGDLGLTDAVISAMDGDGEKYLHITLAFKEDYVQGFLLAQVVSSFEQFAFAAFRKDEYCFYAEAHLPRIKSYTNVKTGVFVERKPHIHIVIPKTNLLSGQHLNPFGVVTHNERFLDAWQEHVNQTMGFASPKDNRRVEFTDESDMISRAKGDVFQGSNKDVRGAILSAMMARSITTQAGFVSLLAEFGATRARNLGKGSEYWNVKAPGAAKGVNLKDYVFSRAFVELPMAEKSRQLAKDFAPSVTYSSLGPAGPSTPELCATLERWHELRAREVRWINSGARKSWREYKAADDVQKKKVLDARAAHFYAKYDPETTHHERRSKNERTHAPRARQRRFGAAPTLASAQSLHGLRSLPGGNVVRDSRGAAPAADEVGAGGAPVLLHGAADHQLGDLPAEDHHSLRRDAESPRRRLTGRLADSVTSQLARDLREQHEPVAEIAIAEIKAKLDAYRLLDELSQSHGVLGEKYAVLRADDGSARIECGSRRLNVSDFLTKEMRLPWSAAAPLLQGVYARQVSGASPALPVREPKRALWSEFVAGRKERTQATKDAVRAVRKSASNDRARVKQQFTTRRDAVLRDVSLTPAGRRDAVAMLRAALAAADVALRQRVKMGVAELREARTPREQYRDWLANLAQTGDAQALVELRRVRVSRGDNAAVPQLVLTPVGSRRSAAVSTGRVHHEPGVTYRVDATGCVTYAEGRRDLLRDAGDSVHVLSAEPAVIALALRIAARFGSLDIAGPEPLRVLLAHVAAEHEPATIFNDPRLRNAQHRRRQDLEAAHSLATKVDEVRQVAAPQHFNPPMAPETEDTLALVERLLSAIEADDERRGTWITLREVDQWRLNGADLRACLVAHPELRRMFVDEMVARASEIDDYETERQAREMPRPGG